MDQDIFFFLPITSLTKDREEMNSNNANRKDVLKDTLQYHYRSLCRQQSLYREYVKTLGVYYFEINITFLDNVGMRGK